MIREQEYINQLTGFNFIIDVVNSKFLDFWIEFENGSFGIIKSEKIKDILSDNRIPFREINSSYIGKIIVRVSDIKSKIRDEKINDILN